MRAMRLLIQAAVLLLSRGLAPGLHAQPQPVVDWQLLPDYRLPTAAGNHPGPRIPLPYEDPDVFVGLPPQYMKGEPAAQTWESRLDSRVLAGRQFALEVLVHDQLSGERGAPRDLRGSA
jgi:hypothetical protein